MKRSLSVLASWPTLDRRDGRERERREPQPAPARSIPVLTLLFIALALNTFAVPICAQPTSEEVLQAIELGKEFLVKNQRQKPAKEAGAWMGGNSAAYPTGVTSLTVLALLNCGMSAHDEPVARGLKFLRNA